MCNHIFSAVPGYKNIQVALVNLSVLILTSRRNLTGGDEGVKVSPV